MGAGKCGRAAGGFRVKSGIIRLVFMLLLQAVPPPWVCAAQANAEHAVLVTSYEDLYNGISHQILNHQDVAYYDTDLNMDAVFDNYSMHYNENDPLASGMYMVHFIEDMEVTRWQASRSYFSGKYNRRYEIRMTYKCTKQELADFIIRMQELAGELKKPTDYESVKAVHDYIAEYVTYDDSLKNHLDLEGFRDHRMVCTGYSMAMFHLLTDMGIGCRIVTGMANSETGKENHEWNVVEVDGIWYNIDATWDDLDNPLVPVCYAYFLKSDADFYDHIRSSGYDGYTGSMAVKSYPEPQMYARIFNSKGGRRIWIIHFVFLCAAAAAVSGYVRRRKEIGGSQDGNE